MERVQQQTRTIHYLQPNIFKKEQDLMFDLMPHFFLNVKSPKDIVLVLSAIQPGCKELAIEGDNSCILEWCTIRGLGESSNERYSE